MIVKNGLVFISGEEELKKVDVKIENEKFSEISENIEGKETLDASGLIVLPGGIDPHVHFNDPGFTEREDFYSGTSAAASGGITTIIDMPCTSLPPVTNLENLRNKLKEIEGKAIVDYGFYAGVSGDPLRKDFSKELESLLSLVKGIKVYLTSSMKTFKSVNMEELRLLFKEINKRDIPVLIHAEDHDLVTSLTEKYRKIGNGPKEFYCSRPEEVEIRAIREASKIAGEEGAKVHICHVGSAEAVSSLNSNLFSCETCPQYLEFNLDDFIKIGSPLKVTPVVKKRGNSDNLWKLLSEGKIDFVGSDHAPCLSEGKSTGSIWTDYAGIPGVETLFPYIFSEGYKKGRISIKKLVEVTSLNAAKRYNLFSQKGSIEIGKDADLVFFDPKKTWTVRGEKFFSKGKITPFEGRKFNGKVVQTILRGEIIFSEEKGITVPAGYGKFL